MSETAEPRVLVTGATDGLGREVARRLAQDGAQVLVHGRDPERVADTVALLAAETGTDPGGHVADFARLADVRLLAEEVAEDHGHLDVLVNNAGIGPGPPGGAREVSEDGHELRFQVNYLASFLLTRLLLPRLWAGAPARVVHVASGAQQAIDFDDVMLTRDYDRWRAYAQSKLAMVADALTLAEALDPREVTVNALHPASLMDTKMVREAHGGGQTTIDEGVEAVVRLVTSPALATVTGRYVNGLAEAAPAAQAQDATARQRLQALTQQLTGLDEAIPGAATPGKATPGKATPGKATPGEALPEG